MLKFVKSLSPNAFRWLIPASYILLRYGFSGWMDGLGTAAYFAVEVGFVSVYAVIFRKQFSLFGPKTSQAGYAWAIPLNLVLGVVLYRAAGVLDIAIPFDFSNFSFLFLMIFLGPISEELIFRFLVWLPFEGIFKAKYFVVIVTSVLFSLSHFWAYGQVDKAVQQFVVYQTIYTFFLALHWGERRATTAGLLAPILLHISLNLSFAMSGYYDWYRFAATDVTVEHSGESFKIAILDMNVKENILHNYLESDAKIEVRRSPQLLERLKLSQASPVTNECSNAISKVEMLMRGEGTDLDEGDFLDVSSQIVKSHGYHVAGTALKNLSGVELLFLAMAPPPTGEISNVDEYVAHEINEQLAWVSDQLSKYKPALVLAATSESAEENFEDLRRAGMDEKSADEKSKRIVGEWRSAWREIIEGHPNILFVFPSGNGGSDGIGDDIEKSNVVPAKDNFPNKVIVSSAPESIEGLEACLSPFSNWGMGRDDLYFAPGEMVDGPSGCEGRPEVSLSGTSQAAAVWTRFLIEEARHRGSPLDSQNGSWREWLAAHSEKIICSKHGLEYELRYLRPSE